jgi:hypothetical protein
MSEFLAATSNSLRAVEIVANDTIVVAGLVSAAAFGNCVCARADGDGRFARAPAAEGRVGLVSATSGGNQHAHHQFAQNGDRFVRLALILAKQKLFG